jgi:hypothetical protein
MQSALILSFKYKQLRIQTFPDSFSFELVFKLLMKEYKLQDIEFSIKRLVIKKHNRDRHDSVSAKRESLSACLQQISSGRHISHLQRH